MGKLFGTDGIRGVANDTLTCDLAFRVAQAAAIVLTEATHHKPRFLIGKDTRISSDMLEAAMIAGFCSVGGSVTSLGVIPTPAVAYLTVKYAADAGVVISASHNPFEHNGIKLFNSEGFKLSDALEERIESIVLDKNYKMPLKVGYELGRATYSKNAVDDYVRFIYDTTDRVFDGFRIAIDCANGAASATAKKLFHRLSCECIMLNDQPNGVNINHNCGSTDIAALRAAVVKHRCRMGVAFDGDADRCLAVDEKGNLVDGDKIMAIFALDMKKNGRLNGDTLVATPMSNLGLLTLMKEHGINVEIAAVGDRYVLERMQQGGYSLGGEQSGHVILLDTQTTGDGQLAAVRLVDIVTQVGMRMSDVARVMEYFPQVMMNVTIANEHKQTVLNDKQLKKAIADCEKKLEGEGRVLVRASGTEPLVRVMVEGREFDTINSLASGIVEDCTAAYERALKDAERLAIR